MNALPLSSCWLGLGLGLGWGRWGWGWDVLLWLLDYEAGGLGRPAGRRRLRLTCCCCRCCS